MWHSENVWKQILISELTLLLTHEAIIALVERLAADTVKLKSLGDKSKCSKESAHGYNTDNTDPRARHPGFLSPLEVT